MPFYLFEELMMGDTLIGGGQAVRQSEKRSYGAYAPAHYLKQYLPKYAGGVDKANAAAKAAGYDNWVAYLHFKKDWTLNPELPVLGPWHTVKPINNPTWVMERNPYYWAVDTEGNQLPYLDGVVMTLAEDLEVLNLRAIAGEYDLQERHVDLGKLPVILDNQEKGNYKVHLDLAFNGADAIYQFNQTYDADPEIAKWLTNADFRRALSLAIDRDQLNQTFWLGVATPGSPAPGESLPYFPGKGWREKWSTYDPDKANQMLDAIGLDKKDADGFRLRTDNGQRLRLEIQAVQAFLPWPKISEMVADQWRKVGIQADVKDTERSLAFTRTQANQHQIMVWNNGGTELLYLFPRHAIPVDPTEAFMGPEYAKWYASNGAQGRKPEDPNMLKILELFRGAAGQKADAADRDRQGDLEDPDRPAVRHRHGRPVAGADGRAPGLEQTGQHPGPQLHRAALPDAGRGASRDLVLQGVSLGGPRCPARGPLCHDRLRRPPPPARDRHHLGDLGRLLRDHPAAARRFRRQLHRQALVLRLDGQRPGGRGDARAVRPQPAGLGPVLEMDLARRPRRLRRLARMEPAGHRGDRRPPVAHDRDLDRRDHPDLGDRAADRDLFGGAPVFDRRLHLHSRGLHRARGAELPARADHHVSLSFRFLDANVGGLFSPAYALAPWSWGKVWDLMAHLPLPALILALAGTAQLIRIMRANLLDELRRPYVTTARARGLQEWRVITKYPVRAALNPFASTIGYLLPFVVSRAASSSRSSCRCRRSGRSCCARWSPRTCSSPARSCSCSAC